MPGEEVEVESVCVSVCVFGGGLGVQRVLLHSSDSESLLLTYWPDRSAHTYTLRSENIQPTLYIRKILDLSAAVMTKTYMGSLNNLISHSIQNGNFSDSTTE